MKHVFENKQLCTGCGVCAGICKNIKMSESSIGHYIPQIDNEKCVKCGLCSGICPILQSTENIRKFNETYFSGKYAVETGYYVSCYEGRSINHFKTSASGGLCTAFLETLIEQNIVDGVYCVGTSKKENIYYEYQLIQDREELKKNSLSAYYPVQLEKVVQQILSEDKKVAIVVLPCQAKALRMAMKKSKILEKRIKVLVGLICGGLPGKAMTEYISRCIGAEDIERITFREKSEDKKCNNCAVHFYTKQNVKKSYYHNDTFGFVYFNKFFHNQACNICEDVFAESADIVFGDAWYKEYKDNIWGTSICLVRNNDLNQIFCNMKNTEIKEIGVDRLILAQENVGVIGMKKVVAPQAYKIYKFLGFKNANVYEPSSKAKISKLKISIRFLKKLIKQCYAQRIWSKYKKEEITFDKLNKKLKIASKLLGK